MGVTGNFAADAEMQVRVLPSQFMERRKVGVLIRLENGDVGNSDVEVRSPYAPP